MSLEDWIKNKEKELYCGGNEYGTNIPVAKKKRKREQKKERDDFDRLLELDSGWVNDVFNRCFHDVVPWDLLSKDANGSPIECRFRMYQKLKKTAFLMVTTEEDDFIPFKAAIIWSFLYISLPPTEENMMDMQGGCTEMVDFFTLLNSGKERVEAVLNNDKFLPLWINFMLRSYEDPEGSVNEVDAILSNSKVFVQLIKQELTT